MINWRPFWKCSNPGHVMWYVIRVSSERVTIIPETTSPSLSSCCRNLRAEKRICSILLSATIKQLREYEIRNGISLLPKGGIIETRQIDRLSELRVNYTPWRTANKKNFSSQPISNPIFKEVFFSSSRKGFNKSFYTVYITLTSGPSIPERAWLRSSSGFLNETLPPDCGNL